LDKFFFIENFIGEIQLKTCENQIKNACCEENSINTTAFENELKTNLT